MSLQRIWQLVLLFCCGASTAPLFGQSFVNGDFSSGSVGCNAGTGWNFTATVGQQPQYTNALGPATQFWIDLTPCGDWGNNVWMEQTLTLTPGTTYSVSLDLGTVCGWDRSDAGVYMFVNGVQVGGRIFNDNFTRVAGTMNWQTRTSTSFVATVASNTIRFVGEGHCTALSPTTGAYACSPVGSLGNPGVIGVDNVVLNIFPPTVICNLDVTVDTLANVACFGGSDGMIDIMVHPDTIPCSSPAVIINELFYRPTVNNGVDPNTGEAIELLGPPNTDISCYVLTDGDWTITIPPGTFIPADGIFTIGNDITQTPGFYDLDAENCACFTEGVGGSALLILTDGGEYISVFNSAGAFIQGVIYGTPTAGNTPPQGASATGGVITTAALAGCPASVTIPAAPYDMAPGGMSTGTSLIRDPDGSGSWAGQVGGSLNDCNTANFIDYTVLWNTGDTTEVLDSLPVGTYTVTITESNGCVDSLTVVITEPTALSTADSTTLAHCSQADGTIYYTTNGGTAPYDYLWNTGDTTATVTGVMAGDYTVTVTDMHGCLVLDTVSVLEAIPMGDSATTTLTTCGGHNGTIDLFVWEGTAPYTYLWSTGDTTEDVTGVSAGGYWVTITDVFGCTLTDSITVFGITPMSDTAIITLATCGNSNGAIDLTIIDGSAPYTYLWNTGDTIADLTGLAVGIYTVTVTDADSCMLINSFSVTTPSDLSAVLLAGQPTCLDTDGSIDLTLSGGTSPYTFLWSTGDTTEDLTGLPAGMYAVTITDANLCGIAESITLLVSNAMTIADSIVHPLCANNNDGEIGLTIGGGTFPYDYAWSTGDTTQNLPNLVAGMYSVTVTDSVGCMAIDTFVLVEPMPVDVVTDSIHPVTCSGGNDGAVFITVSGGTSPYTYLWNDGSTQEDITGTGGAYWATVTDANGCIDFSDTIVVLQPMVIALTLTPTPSSCTIEDGSISLTATGGWGSYTYLWSDGNTNQNLTGVGAGMYSVTVTDLLGCEMVDSAQVIGVSGLMAQDTVLNVGCNSDSTGAISISITGGNAPFSFVWNTGATSQNLVGIPAGTYSLTITDAANCTVSLNNQISEPAALVVSVGSVTDESCTGETDGAIDITTAGGTTPYTFGWNNGAATEDLNDLAGGQYMLTVTDNNGCTATAVAAIEAAPAIQLTLSSTDSLITCDKIADANLLATATGGGGSWNYLWSNSATTAQLNNLAAGTYTVTATDGAGCTISDSYTISSLVVADVQAYIGTVGNRHDTIMIGDVLQINGLNNAGGVLSYSWYAIPNNGLTIASLSSVPTSLTATNGGYYTITLLGQSQDNCNDVDTLYIWVEQGEFWGMPTAFTPNGDGTNDLLRPVQLDAAYISEFKVYNRFGELVYGDATLSDGGWNGMHKGQAQARDVYMYVLTYQQPTDAEPVTLRGEVMLVR